MVKNVNLRNFINTALKFDEETHTYTYNGNKLVSVTQLLAKHGLSPDYSGVNEELLKKSAAYGTYVHSQIENYIKTGEVGDSIELVNFISWLETSGYEIVDCEYLVNNDIIGGKVDLLLKHIESEVYVICDIKTTSVIHEESVSWQLSIYNYLDEDIALLGMCLHFLKDGTLEVKSVPLKTPRDIEALINAERHGEKFVYQIATIDSAIAQLSTLEKVVKNYDTLMKQAKEEQEILKAKIKEEMESRNIKTLDLPTMKITITAPSERETFDSKKFKVDNPETYAKYVKTTQIKSTLKITLKESDE